MLRAVVINDREAIIFFPNKNFNLYSSDGNVRQLVREFLMPLSCNEDCKTPDAYDRACAGMSEDTVVLNAA